VLVVDDNEDVRELIVRFVELMGHDVAAAGNGLIALFTAKSFQPDCAILDLSLHDITGLDLARRLREASPSRRRPYLIALTAYGDEVMREACLAAGFDAYLLKTADIQALETLLEQ
jgi:two-component system OmpR family response regulator